MVICHEILPASYLLVLASTTAGTAEAELAAHLARACRSGKPAVWIDCRLLHTLSATGAWLLWACHKRLHRRQARLVLCQVTTLVEQQLRAVLAGAGVTLQIVPTLEEAEALL
jgi:anti-anti-sigma regulatory factor